MDRKPIIIILIIVLILSILINIYLFTNSFNNSSGPPYTNQYGSEVDINANPSTKCSDKPDNICPRWCAAGSDYDCCVRIKEYEWVEGRGCYSKT